MTQKKARKLRDALRGLIVANGGLNENERPCGTSMSIAHAYTLLELLEHTSLSLSSLTQKLSIDRTNVSRLCIRMENDGELLREVDKNDARARVLKLTESGVLLAKSVEISSVLHFEKLVKKLDNSDQVIQALTILENAITQLEEEK